VELIFDRGVGDLFVIRVAGNVAGESELASIEYGLGHLNCPLLLVLGHTRCGAVTAAATGAKLHGHLPKLAEKILPAVDKAKAKTKDASLLVPASIEANIWQVMEEVLRQSEEVRQLVAASKTQIVGALYDLETGEVKWLGHHPDEKNLLLAKPAAKPPPAMEHEQRSPAAAEPETDVVHSRSSPAVNPMVRPAASVH
jgi:carbonic anhydrase